MTRGLEMLQAGLDAHEEPADWPADVCRDAWCGHWERNDGQYFWHTPADHNAPTAQPQEAPDLDGSESAT